MTKTTMATNTFQTLKILPHLVVPGIGQKLRIFSILDILLTIEKPVGDAILKRILENGDNTLQRILIQFSGTKQRLDGDIDRKAYRLERSTSALRQTTVAKRRPTPLMAVRAKTIFRLPSTLVLRIRRMCWNPPVSGTLRVYSIQLVTAKALEKGNALRKMGWMDG